MGPGDGAEPGLGRFLVFLDEDGDVELDEGEALRFTGPGRVVHVCRAAPGRGRTRWPSPFPSAGPT